MLLAKSPPRRGAGGAGGWVPCLRKAPYPSFSYSYSYSPFLPLALQDGKDE